MIPTLGPLSLKLDMVTKDHLGYRIHDPSGAELAIVVSRGDIKQAAADARLLKSAPEMLQILSEIAASDCHEIPRHKIASLIDFIMSEPERL